MRLMRAMRLSAAFRLSWASTCGRVESWQQLEPQPEVVLDDERHLSWWSESGCWAEELVEVVSAVAHLVAEVGDHPSSIWRMFCLGAHRGLFLTARVGATSEMYELERPSQSKHCEISCSGMCVCVTGVPQNNRAEAEEGATCLRTTRANPLSCAARSGVPPGRRHDRRAGRRRGRGIIVSTFTVGTRWTPRHAFAVEHLDHLARLREAPLLGVSVLGESHGELARQVAGKDRTARFDGLDLHRADSGSLLVEGAPVWLECSLYDEVPAGDHQVVLLRVDGLASDAELEPLVFQRSSFRRLREWE